MVIIYSAKENNIVVNKVPISLRDTKFRTKYEVIDITSIRIDIMMVIFVRLNFQK
jgi:hypothetical protein